jgi:DICT domain-containing protein
MESFEEILAAVEAARPTVVVYADDPSAALTSRLGPVDADVQYEAPGPTGEDRIAVRRDGTTLAEVSLETFLATDPPDRVPWNPTAAEADLRAFLSTLSGVHFVSLDRGRLLDVSRSIEDHVWHHEAGNLHAGFQRLSNLEPAVETYRRLADCSDLSLWLYGTDDWTVPPLDGATVLTPVHDEIRDYWFLAYDGGGDDDHKRVLLAREVSPGQYRGVWTTDERVVDAVVSRLASHYPGVERSETA